MKSKVLIILLATLLATTFVVPEEISAVSAEREPLEFGEVRKLVEKANEAGALPAGVVVRVHADMWNAGEKDKTEFEECWEFTSAKVHRITTDEKANESVYRREKSLAFDSRRMCHDLAEGQIFEINENNGPGKPVTFALALSDFYNRGQRSIDILIDNKSVFHLGESHLMAGYREPHARAFATLYEKLASRARAAFGEFWARETLLAASETNSWPRGMVVRLGADVHVHGDMNTQFQENWEFSDGQVHRIRLEFPGNKKVVRRRLKSIAFDTKSICDELIDGRAFEIASDDSPENGLLLADYEAALGGRSLEVLIDGKSALELCEHCTGAVYGETHARAFAKLYERLASQARAAFANPKGH